MHEGVTRRLMAKHQSQPPLLLIIAFSLASLIFTSKLINVSQMLSIQSSPRNERLNPASTNAHPGDHTYSIEDYPERWSLPLKKVLLQVEESVHYAIDELESPYEWNELNVESMASVRIGPDKHAALLPMFHELHCIQSFKDEIRGFGLSNTEPDHSWEHIQHCANYLRQWALCRSDLTLEPGDFMQKDYDLEREGAVHECLDWQAVFPEMDADWDAWISLWKSKQLNRFLNQPPHPNMW